MIMITQTKVWNNTVQFSLWNTELMSEKIIPTFADHNMGALTNCSSERRIETIDEANIIMKMKTCTTVSIIPVRWSFSKVTFSMFWLQHLPNIEV